MEPFFGQLKAEWSGPSKTVALGPFLFLVGGLLNDPAVLRVCVTDFHSNTWESRKSKTQLEDMVSFHFFLFFNNFLLFMFLG